MSQLTEWDSFYVIVGSAAGALIGLQFVAMTLIAQRPPTRSAEAAGTAFATPTIVHFSAALFLAAIMRMPWHSILPLSYVWGIMGFAGMSYSIIVAARIRKQDIYKPVFEDWLFHFLLPLLSYVLLAVACFGTDSLYIALFGVAASTLLMLFIGIHNSWDAVAYHVLTRAKAKSPAKEPIELKQ